MRVLVCGHRQVIEQISPILSSLGAEAVTSTELPADDSLKTIKPDLILLHANDELLQTVRPSHASVPIYILLDDSDQDWSLLSRIDACGYMSIHVGDEILNAYLKGIVRQAISTCDKDI